MEYIEVQIEITPFSDQSAEIVTAEIESLGFDSFVVEEPFLKAYIPRQTFVEQHLKAVLSIFIKGDFVVKYSLNLIKEQNWNEVWESNFDPIIIDGKCTIKASFHKGLKRTKYNITIDPKMAFGTGHHQTTSLMVKGLLDAHALDKSFIKDKQVLDMGSGTGILAILVAKMGALNMVHAIDIDHIAVWSSLENAYRNKVAKKIKAICGDAVLIQAGKYDLILANINRNILLEDMSTYSRGLRPNGDLFLSGFYEEDIPILLTEARKHNLEYVSSMTMEKWAMLKLHKNLHI